MKVQNISDKKGLALGIKQREAGSFVGKDGKIVAYGDATQLIFLPYEETANISKLTIEPDCVEAVLDELASASWGCLVKLQMSKGKVTKIEVISNLIENLMEQ